jgi:hypothetical protein
MTVFGWLKKRAPSSGPDYSGVDSIAKAQELVARGELSPLYLLPAAFGGDDAPPNTVYVPEFVLDIKRGIDENTVMPLVQEGKVTRYTANPKYEGRSVVPNALEIHAHDPANFHAEIQIWGDALSKEAPSAI